MSRKSKSLIFLSLWHPLLWPDEEIHLMGDVDQPGARQLLAPLRQPVGKDGGVQFGPAGQRALEEVQDEPQEIGFVSRITPPLRIDDPVRGAGSQDLRPGS